GQADENQISAITSMQVNLYGKQRLKGVGKNPSLAQAKSKNDKTYPGFCHRSRRGRSVFIHLRMLLRLRLLIRIRGSFP
ncbi:MAG: hypothetical protein J6Z22_00460, partial [Lachnospiraceae bacterium]|nr:hypothetical protein [Lachnospiraceae bacterium]